MFVELLITTFPNVHVISSGSDVVEVSTLFSSIGFLVEVDVSSLIVAASADDLIVVEVSVTGLLLLVDDDKVAWGRLVVFRVTTVDLIVGVVVLDFSVVESIVCVVTIIFSADKVDESTLTMCSAGVGRGRGAFDVAGRFVVIFCDVDDEVDVAVLDECCVVVIGLLVVVNVEFLLDGIVVLRFTVTFVDATGFLVVFITVDVAFFDGFTVVVVIGLLVNFTVLLDIFVDVDGVVAVDSDETDVLFSD